MKKTKELKKEKVELKDGRYLIYYDFVAQEKDKKSESN